MVEFVTPRLSPSARPAGQVSDAPERILADLSTSIGQTADSFTNYYEEQAGINRERILFEVQEQTQRAYNDSSKDAGPGYAKAFVGDLDKRIAEYMKAAPERGRDALDLALDKYRMQTETKALKAEAMARARAAAAGRAAANRARAETVRLRGNEILSDPSALASAVEQDPDNTDYYSKLALSARLDTDPDAVQAEVQDGRWDANLSPSEKLKFMRQSAAGVARMDREAEAVLQVERKEFEAAAGEDVAYLEVNGMLPPNPAMSDEALGYLYETESERADVQQAYDEAVTMAETVYGVGSASPEELASQITTLDDALKEPGRTPSDVANMNRFVGALDQRNESIRNDPASHLIKTMPMLQDMLGNYEEASAEAKPILMNRIKSLMDTEFERLGVPVEMRSYLTKSQAIQMATAINDAPPGEGGASLQGLREQMGDAAPSALAQLRTAGLTEDAYAKLRHWGDPRIQRWIDGVRGQSATDLMGGIDPDRGTRADIENAVIIGLAEYTESFVAGGSAQAYETIGGQRELAARIVMSRMVGDAAVDMSAVVDSTIAAMFPEEAVNESDMKFILPTQFSRGAVVNSLRSVVNNLPEEFVIDFPGLPDFADAPVFEASMRSNAMWIANSTGNGVVLAYQYESGGHPVPIKSRDGEFLEVFFDNLPVGLGDFSGPGELPKNPRDIFREKLIEQSK